MAALGECTVCKKMLLMQRHDNHVCPYCEAESLRATISRLEADLAASKRAVEALVEFAGTVAPGSSWWDDVWPAHDAAMAGGEK